MIKNRRKFFKKVFFFLAVVSLLSLVFFLFRPLFLQNGEQQFVQHPGSASFVTRNGNTLFLNGEPFHFSGTNIHWLGLLQGPTKNPLYPSQERVDNVLAIANKMHADVIRSTTMGISLGCSNCIEPDVNTFNDAAFEPIDYALQKAKRYNMHLIIPLIDRNNYYNGGIYTFADWLGIAVKDFYTNQTAIQDYESSIAHLLNHVNPYTGIAYKDDPTIMLWEVGNETYDAPNSWTETIAEYIKRIDPNHLVGDGKQANHVRDLSQGQLHLPAVDVYTSHFYYDTLSTFNTRMQISANLAKQYNKVYFIGEYDWTALAGTPDDLSTFLSGTVDTAYNVSGALFWELYDNGYAGDKYTLHYPGDTANMKTRVQIISTVAAIMSTPVKSNGYFSAYNH